MLSDGCVCHICISMNMENVCSAFWADGYGQINGNAIQKLCKFEGGK